MSILSAPGARRKVGRIYPAVVVAHAWPCGPETVALRLRGGHHCPLMLTVEGKAPECYWLRSWADPSTGETLGFGLTHMDDAQRCYHLPADLSDCCCGDSSWRRRPGGCKHRVGLSAALAEAGVI